MKDFNLSNKEWVNLKTILNGMFEYAYRMKYLQENLNTYLDEMYEKTGDVAFMAVKMNFFMGLRVGELVSLKWEDICEGNQIHIVREEVRDQVANEITVADHTKTHTDRFVYPIPDALEILEKLPKAGEYIFMRDGKRLTSRQINYVLEKYAERVDLQVKSSHKLRKTYASMCGGKRRTNQFHQRTVGTCFIVYHLRIYLQSVDGGGKLQDVNRCIITKERYGTGAEDRQYHISANARQCSCYNSEYHDNVVSLDAFQSKTLTVPKMSSNVPTFSNA